MRFNAARLRYFRMRNKTTQKQLGCAIGYSENTADVRIAQYEQGGRAPKLDAATKLATELGVSLDALSVPVFTSSTEVMHMFFAMEDDYGLEIQEINGQPCLTLNPELLSSQSAKKKAADLQQLLMQWHEQTKLLADGKITKEEYDNWRYRYAAPALVEEDSNPVDLPDGIPGEGKTIEERLDFLTERYVRLTELLEKMVSQQNNGK